MRPNPHRPLWHVRWPPSVVAAALLSLALAPPAGAAAPAMVGDLGTVAIDSYPHWGVPGFTAVDGWTYYAADEGVHGRELWRTDGTPGGERRLTDICPGDCPAVLSLHVEPFVGRVHYAADDGVAGPGLWATDTDTLETVRLASLARPAWWKPGWMLAFGDLLLVGAVPVPGQCGLSAVAADGTLEVLLAHPCDGWDDGPSDLTPVGGVVVFAAAASAAGRELWRTDGTAAGTWLLVDVQPGAGSGLPSASFGVRPGDSWPVANGRAPSPPPGRSCSSPPKLRESDASRTSSTPPPGTSRC